MTSRWFPWLSDPDPGIEELDQREWERQNVFLIPARKARAQAPRCLVSQLHAERAPSQRASVRHQAAGLQGNYGRFGKSCPPGLEPPIERQDEEEAAQEEGSCRGLKRSHSTSKTTTDTKQRSLDCVWIRSTSSDALGDKRAEPTHAGIEHGRHDSSHLNITPSSGPYSALQQFMPPQRQQQHLPMRRWQPAHNPFRRPEDLSEVAMQLNGSSEDVSTPEASDSETDSSMADGPVGNVRPPLLTSRSLLECGPRASRLQCTSLDELLDDTVRDLSGLSVKCQSAPVMSSGRCATVDALNESLSNGSLNAMLEVGDATSRRASYCPAMQIRRDSAPALRRAFSSAYHGWAPTSPGKNL